MQCRTNTALSSSTQKNDFADESRLVSDDDDDENEEYDVSKHEENSKHIVLSPDSSKRIQNARDARKEFFESEHNTVESNSSKNLKDDLETDTDQSDDNASDTELKDKRVDDKDNTCPRHGAIQRDTTIEIEYDDGGTSRKHGDAKRETSIDISTIDETTTIDISYKPASEADLVFQERKKERSKPSESQVRGKAEFRLGDQYNIKDLSMDDKIRIAQEVEQKLSMTAREALDEMEESLTSLKEEARELEETTLSRIRKEADRIVGQEARGSKSPKEMELEARTSGVETRGRTESGAQSVSSVSESLSNKQ